MFRYLQLISKPFIVFIRDGDDDNDDGVPVLCSHFTHKRGLDLLRIPFVYISSPSTRGYLLN